MGDTRRGRSMSEKVGIISLVLTGMSLLWVAPSTLADGFSLWDRIRPPEVGSPSWVPGPSHPSGTQGTPSAVNAGLSERNEVLVEPFGPGSRCSKWNGSVRDIHFRACVKVEDAGVAFAARLTNLTSTPMVVTVNISWVRNDSPFHACGSRRLTVPAGQPVDTDLTWCVAPRVNENAAYQAAVDVARGESDQWQARQFTPVTHVYAGRAPDAAAFTCGGAVRC